jgi:predicted dehydrogenase
MKLGIAILGVGRWGVHLVRIFANHPSVEIVAIVDPYPERLVYCQEQLGIDANKVVLATEWETVRTHPRLQTVVVVTPASGHYPLILDALNLGYHVLAEKPLTLDPQECLELTRLAASKQLQLLIDHTYLFHPAITEGRDLVAAGSLGDLHYGYASRTHLSPVRQDVDALWDLAIHDIAIFNCWLGETPIAVRARGKVWLQPEKRMDISATMSGLADLVWLTLTYPSGFEAEIHLCWSNQDKQRKLCVVGSQGTLIFDELVATPLVVQRGHFERDGERFIPAGVKTEAIELPKAEPLKNVVDRFINNILTGATDPISSGWVATELVQVLTCLSQSLERDGISIEVPRLYS